MKILFIISLFFVLIKTQITTQITAQNLVKNPSFEEITSCDIYLDDFKKVKHWEGFSFTPDIFSTCSESQYFKTPKNIFDTQTPASGNNYAGFLTYHRDYPIELIGQKLEKPIQKGDKISVSFKVSRAVSHSNTATNNIGLLFTNQPQKALKSKKVHINQTEILTEGEIWHEIKGIIEADSTYEYFVIGNFFSKEDTRKQKMNAGTFEAAYYFIDDVSITTYAGEIPATKISEKNKEETKIITNPLEESKKLDMQKVAIAGKIFDANTREPLVAVVEFFVPEMADKQQYETDDITGQYAFAGIFCPERFGLRITARNYYPIVEVLYREGKPRYARDFYLMPLKTRQNIELHHVEFIANEDELAPNSFEELNRLIEVLREHPTMKIELGGYTDNESQLALAQKRAMSIKKYLIKFGQINEKRMITKSYHSLPAKNTGALSGEKEKFERMMFKILN
ncbi:MAG: OmpA family protein [Bacteroidetes bacterium]|nr:MAG: OmpA family protein [Bacteroidota bacterium]TAG94166.1 MAG: OmpA family protein [Bacteroidota bacterium]